MTFPEGQNDIVRKMRDFGVGAERTEEQESQVKGLAKILIAARANAGFKTRSDLADEAGVPLYVVTAIEDEDFLPDRLSDEVIDRLGMALGGKDEVDNLRDALGRGLPDRRGRRGRQRGRN